MCKVVALVFRLSSRSEYYLFYSGWEESQFENIPEDGASVAIVQPSSALNISNIKYF